VYVSLARCTRRGGGSERTKGRELEPRKRLECQNFATRGTDSLQRPLTSHWSKLLTISHKLVSLANSRPSFGYNVCVCACEGLCPCVGQVKNSFVYWKWWLLQSGRAKTYIDCWGCHMKGRNWAHTQQQSKVQYHRTGNIIFIRLHAWLLYAPLWLLYCLASAGTTQVIGWSRAPLWLPNPALIYVGIVLEYDRVHLVFFLICPAEFQYLYSTIIVVSVYFFYLSAVASGKHLTPVCQSVCLLLMGDSVWRLIKSACCMQVTQVTLEKKSQQRKQPNCPPSYLSKSASGSKLNISGPCHGSLWPMNKTIDPILA